MEKVKEILDAHQITNFEFIPMEEAKNFYKTILLKDKLKEKVKTKLF